MTRALKKISVNLLSDQTRDSPGQHSQNTPKMSSPEEKTAKLFPKNATSPHGIAKVLRLNTVSRPWDLRHLGSKLGEILGKIDTKGLFFLHLPFQNIGRGPPPYLWMVKIQISRKSS